VVTATEVVQVDIGIRSGKIANLGHDIRLAADVVDVGGLIAILGDTDSQV